MKKKETRAMESRAASVTCRVIVSVVYAVIVSVATSVVLKLARAGAGDDASGISAAHMSHVRSLVLTPSRTERLSRVGGLKGVKRELYHAVLLPLRYPHIFFAQPATRPAGGVLLHGPPGTGKTMLARAVAAEGGVPFLALHSAGLESKWWGESPKLLQAAFTLARTELAPCIVFFDEIDGLGRRRTEADQSCVYSFKCELLRHMDGIQDVSDSPVLVLACTNCAESLDPALRRRFGRAVRVARPDEDERVDILRKLTRGEARTSQRLLRRVARAAEGLTGADLAVLYAEASTKRMESIAIEHEVSNGIIADGSDLVRRLGSLDWTHWAASGRLMSRSQGRSH